MYAREGRAGGRSYLKRSMVVPGGRRPWCCCHLRDCPNRAMRREGGTTLTTPARAEGGREGVDERGGEGEREGDEEREGGREEGRREGEVTCSYH